MTTPAHVRGTYVAILMGNGETVEAFNILCGINTRSFTHQINTTDFVVRDCDDPEGRPFRKLIDSSEQWDITGSGLMNRAQLADIQAAVGETRNFRFRLGQPAGDAIYGGYYEGPAKITQLTIDGNDEEQTAISLTIASDGQWLFVPVA